MKHLVWFIAVIGLLSAKDALANTITDAPKAAATLALAQEYPHRSSYPDVPVITTADLSKELNAYIVVDVRSPYEYQTLHVRNAVNIPITDKKFFERAKLLHAENQNKPLVFYCNGKTCKKSYDAVRLAKHAGVDKSMCFDAGILEWAKANPDRTVLLGRSPIKETDLITAERFKLHTLAAKDFESNIGQNTLVLDIRDLAQRDIALFPFREERAPLDQTEKLNGVIEKAKSQNKTLLVYDKAGHQIQWFQYYLEHKGLKNYYFLKGGSEGYFESTLGAKIGLNK